MAMRGRPTSVRDYRFHRDKCSPAGTWACSTSMSSAATGIVNDTGFAGDGAFWLMKIRMPLGGEPSATETVRVASEYERSSAAVLAFAAVNGPRASFLPPTHT